MSLGGAVQPCGAKQQTVARTVIERRLRLTRPIQPTGFARG
jgi:hypothetical protein